MSCCHALLVKIIIFLNDFKIPNRKLKKIKKKVINRGAYNHNIYIYIYIIEPIA